MGLPCALAGAWLASHHPLSGIGAAALFALVLALAFRAWTWTPLILGVLPILGLASWSGWLTVEELDLLVLAAAAGAYLAWGLAPRPRERHRQSSTKARQALVLTPAVSLLLLAMAVALLTATVRGVADAGGLTWGWFQGYHEPLNSVRVGKSFFQALLMLPLWMEVGARQPKQVGRTLLWGLSLAVLCVSLAALWERVAFPGLLNFSSDYRTTALFWEMHVGGAALDACLSMSIPFAVLALLRAQTRSTFAALTGLSLLAAYVALTTFSRIVYVSVPLGVVLMGVLRARQTGVPAIDAVAVADRPATAATGRPPAGEVRVGMALWALALLVSAGLVFAGGGGYRALLALVGAALSLLALPQLLWQQPLRQRRSAWFIGLVGACVLSSLCGLLVLWFTKLAYVLYALVLALNLGLCWRLRARPWHESHAVLLVGAWLWLLGGTVLVAGNWGGMQAGVLTLLAVLMLAGLMLLTLLRPGLWPWGRRNSQQQWRHKALMFVGLLIASAAVAALSGGTYLLNRAANSQDDWQGRERHWRQSLGLLSGADERWLGKGAGRFLAGQYFSGLPDSHVGDYRVKHEEAQSYLALSAGQHMLGHGEMFRVWQRIAPPQGNVQLMLRARAVKPVSLHVEVCARHLLYPDSCLSHTQELAASPDWQTLQIPLGTAAEMGGAWYAPRLVSFALAVGNMRGQVDLTQMALHDSSGRDLLANGNFDQEMARWFFSSDRHHMPWHAKNLIVHVLYEQGIVGLLLLLAAVGLAFWNVCVGRGRQHEVAPALAAALLGFLIVGAVDSLLDTPRISFMFYTLLLHALTLQGASPHAARTLTRL
ncbi:hypothetical protein [Roseateles koreensis]|nr:hypothetical protein [Roseateles koreensis]